MITLHAGTTSTTEKARPSSDTSTRYAALDALRSPVYLLDGAGRVLWSNHAATILLSAESSANDTVVPFDTFLRQWVANGVEARSIEFTRAGRRFRATLDALAVGDPAEPSAICVLTDLSEQRRAESALRQSEERGRLLTESLDAALFVCGRDLKRIHFVNPAYERIWGRTAQSLREQPRSWLEAVHPIDLPRALAGCRDLGRGKAQAEYRVRRPDGSTRWVSARAFPLRAADGRVDRVAVLARDITEQKEYESQRQRSQRLESLGTLSSGIAHDFNNVLTPIGLAAELLQGVTDAETRTQLLNTLQRSVERGSTLVRQILTFVRGKEGERRPLLLRGIILETIQLLQHTLPNSIRLETHLLGETWPVVADATQINQVLVNLCVNARDAMSQGGRIIITAINHQLSAEEALRYREATPGRYVRLTVTDQGTGIPPEILGRIFDPFFTTKPAGQGTGLGLSTVQKIVRGHGGFVDVRSRPDKGTQFHAFLPAAEEAIQPGTDVAQAVPQPGRGELVLVVDDEDAIREIASATLKANGYRALTAGNGAEALNVFDRHKDRIAAAVVDMMMPEVDGTATMRALREINPRLPLLAASGLAGPEADAHIPGGEPLFLAKPYSTQQLLEALRRTLGEKASRTP